MSDNETYGAEFVAALQKLSRLTILSYADRQEIAGMTREQLALRMRGFRYEFFKAVRDQSPQHAAEILYPKRHLWAAGTPPPMCSPRFVAPTLKQVSAAASPAVIEPDAAYGARFMRRIQELTDSVPFTFAERREYETLNQDEFARRCKRHSFELFLLIQEHSPETAAEVLVEYQRLVALRASAMCMMMVMC